MSEIPGECPIVPHAAEIAAAAYGMVVQQEIDGRWEDASGPAAIESMLAQPGGRFRVKSDVEDGIEGGGGIGLREFVAICGSDALRFRANWLAMSQKEPELYPLDARMGEGDWFEQLLAFLGSDADSDVK